MVISRLLLVGETVKSFSPQIFLDEEIDEENPDPGHIQLVDEHNPCSFLTKTDYEAREKSHILTMETDEYRRAYQHAFDDFQNQMTLRNRTVSKTTKDATDPASTSGTKTVEIKNSAEAKGKGEVKEKTQPKMSDKKDTEEKETEKSISTFNLEQEISKIKVFVPFNELLKNTEYRKQIQNMLISQENRSDILNLEDDHPALLFGPRVADSSTEYISPFYISLNVLGMTLRNAMVDSGASHNLMPLSVMEKLGLDITRPYKSLFSFDSRKVECVGLIKDLVVSITQIPARSVLLDVVVADIPPKFGMLLARNFTAKLGGSMQMDMTYASIPVFGEQRRLYRESYLAYMMSSPEHPENHPVYSVQTDMSSSVLYNDFSLIEEKQEVAEDLKQNEEEQFAMQDGLWSMSFDGVVSREGAGAGVWVISPKGNSTFHALKLQFECTNNEAEYEALMTGLRLLIQKKAKRITVQGDSELIIKQVQGVYQSKHPRMRAYRNAVLDLLENFSEFVFSVIPRIRNTIPDSLAAAASVSKVPVFPNIRYELEVIHRPSVPDNVKNWQVFENDKQIEE